MRVFFNILETQFDIPSVVRHPDATGKIIPETQGYTVIHAVTTLGLVFGVVQDVLVALVVQGIHTILAQVLWTHLLLRA